MNSAAVDMTTDLGERARSHSALLTLEAMRLGVVPGTELDAYTVGRDRELDLVRSDFDDVESRGGAIRAFLGDYGTGKTHLLGLVRQLAAAEGFVTARVVLDPEETAPSHPKRVYRELVRSLEYPGEPQGQGLKPLFDRAAMQPEVIDQFHLTERVKAREVLDEGAHLYLTPALRYFRTVALEESNGRPHDADTITDAERDYALRLLFDWLEGHPTISNREIDDILRRLVRRQGRIFSMMDYRPWARIYGYILSGLASLTRLVGYRGLVVLIDEAEFYSLLSAQNRQFAETVFKAFAWASVGGEETPVPFSRDDLDLGGMGILQDLPPRYGDDGGLYPIFAMTPNETGTTALEEAVPTGKITEISRLQQSDYRQLASRVAAHYRCARPDAEISEQLEGALEKLVAGLLQSGYVENPRQAMKFVVEFLDLATHCEDRMREVVAELRQIYGA